MKKEYLIDLEIYNKEILKEVLDIFKDYGKIVLSDNKIIIEGEQEEEIEELFNELMNYYIGYTNELN